MYKLNSAFQVLYVKDIQDTHRFYQQIGAQIIKLEVDKVVVKLSDYEIHFIDAETEPWDEYKYIAKLPEKGGSIIFYLETTNLQAAFKLVKEAGGLIKSEIKENWWNASEFLFEDKDGYKFVIFSYKNEY